MAELAALNVKINGDASGLQGALQVAEGGLERVGVQAAQTQRQVLASSTGMGRLGQVFQRNSFAISNAANQFSDLAVQMSMGVPATRALSQQLPQMTAFMGPLATIIGVTSGILIGLAGNFLAASSNATTYADALDELERITNDIKRANDVLDTSMYDLIARYGAAAQRVRELAVAELELAIARQRGAVTQAMQNEELEAAVRDYGRLTKVVDELGNTYYDTSVAARAIERDLGVGGQTASELAISFNALQNALTVEDQVAAWTRINELFDRAGISLSELPPELASALGTVIDLEQAMIDYAAAAQNAAAATEGIRLALPQTTGGIGPGIRDREGRIMLPGMSDDEEDEETGGRSALANRIERDLEQLREGFMSQEELQIAAYERQQEILQQALDRRLITQQEYNSLMQDAQAQHQDRMSAIDVYRYGTGVQQTQQFMGQMANALQSGNEKMARISRVFAAGETLINAWRSYSQVLADPTLPFFAKLPAALSILSAGMGAVNAIRGMGGGGGGGGGAGASAASTAASQPAQLPTQTLRFDFGGQNTMGMEQMVDLLNNAYDRGYRIRAVMA